MNKNENWLFFDFETLGTNPLNCATFMVSYISFSYEDILEASLLDIIKRVKLFKFDLKEQLNLGWKIEEKTLEWWKTQPKDIKKYIKPDKEKDGSLNDFVTSFSEYVANKNPRLWWSRGNNFDPVILNRIFSSQEKNLNDLLTFYGCRDIRTYLHTRFDFSNNDISFDPLDDKKFDKFKHHPTMDIALDILRMQKIERIFQE